MRRWRGLPGILEVEAHDAAPARGLMHVAAAGAVRNIQQERSHRIAGLRRVPMGRRSAGAHRPSCALLYSDSKVLLLSSPPKRSVWLPTIFETFAFHCCTLVSFGLSERLLAGMTSAVAADPDRGHHVDVADEVAGEVGVETESRRSRSATKIARNW